MVLLRTQPGAASYEWMTPTGERQGSDSLWANAQGSYAVRVTSVDGCVGTSPPVTLHELPRLDAGIEGPRNVCAGKVAEYRAIADPSVVLTWAAEGAMIEGELHSRHNQRIMADCWSISHHPDRGKRDLRLEGHTACHRFDNCTTANCRTERHL
jgi:hypothetical protein